MTSDKRVHDFMGQHHRGSKNFHRVLILEADAKAEVIPQRVQCRYCERLNPIATQCVSCGAPPAPWPKNAPPPPMLVKFGGDDGA